MIPTNELSIKTMERVIKFIQKGNPQWIVVKDVNCSQSAMFKFGANMKEMKWLKKENLLADHERHQSVEVENLKQ